MHVDVVDVALAAGRAAPRARCRARRPACARTTRCPPAGPTPSASDHGVAALPFLPAVRLLQIEPRDEALALGRRQASNSRSREQRQRQLARLAHVAREQLAAIEVQRRVGGDARHRALHDVGRGRAQLVERAPRARRRTIAHARRRLATGRQRPELDRAHGAGQRRDAAMQPPRRRRVPQAQPRHARSRRAPRPILVGELEAARARLRRRLDRCRGQLLGDARRLMLGIGAAQKLHRAIAVGDDEIGGDARPRRRRRRCRCRTSPRACSSGTMSCRKVDRLRIGGRRGRLARRPLLAQQTQELLEPVHDVDLGRRVHGAADRAAAAARAQTLPTRRAAASSMYARPGCSRAIELRRRATTIAPLHRLAELAPRRGTSSTSQPRAPSSASTNSAHASVSRPGTHKMRSIDVAAPPRSPTTRSSATRSAPDRGARRQSGQAATSVPSSSSTMNDPQLVDPVKCAPPCRQPTMRQKQPSIGRARQRIPSLCERTEGLRRWRIAERMLPYSKLPLLPSNDADRDLALRGQAQASSSFVSSLRAGSIIAFYALLLPPSVYFALKVQQDNSLDRLIVQTDPDVHREQARSRGVFGHGEYVLVLVEANDPFAPAVLRRFDELERAVGKVPHVTANSALSVFKRAKGGFDGTPEHAADVQAIRQRHRSLPQAGARRRALAGAAAVPRRQDDRTSAPPSSTASTTRSRPTNNRRRRSPPSAKSASPTSTPTSTTTRARPATNISRSSCSSSSSSTGSSIDRSARSSRSCSRSASAPRRPSASSASPAARSPSSRRWCR